MFHISLLLIHWVKTFHNRDIQHKSLKGSNILAQGNALGKVNLKN